MSKYLAGLMTVVVLASSAHAQVAGSTTIGMATERLDAVALGWSAKRQILGRTVYNEMGQKVGTIDDVIVAPDRTVNVAIISVGGLVGARWHQVAVPVDQLTRKDATSFVLPGATKGMIKSMPVFRYSSEARNASSVGTPAFTR